MSQQPSSLVLNGARKDAKAATLLLLRNLSEAIVIPGLQALGRAAVRLLELDEVEENQEECRLLASRVAEVAEDFLVRSGDLKLSDLDTSLEADLKELEQCTVAITAFVEGLTNRHIGGRIAHASDISKEIKRHNTRLDAAVSRFHRGTLLSLRLSNIRLEKAGLSVSQRLGVAQFLVPMDLPMSRLPPQPGIFLGRNAFVDSIVSALQSAPSAAVTILGPGGIGKTALALAVAHDVRVIEKFGKHRLFISCDGTTSAAGIVSILATALKLSGQEDMRAAVIESFRNLRRHTLVLLDNLESAWDTPDRAQVEEFLTELAGVENMALVVTMRGALRPEGPAWSRPFLRPLGPLDLSAARELYTSLCTVEDDTDLDKLLETVDCWPLAIRLMAAIGQCEASPKALLKRYRLENIQMLNRAPPENRLTSLSISIGVTLDSHTMKRHPQALELLSLLSLLPDGVTYEHLEHIFPSMRACHKAADTLQKASLVSREGNGALRVLSPIRSFMCAFHPAKGHHWDEMEGYYRRLAARGDEMGTASASDAIHILTRELGNVQSILMHALLTREEQLEVITSCILSLSSFCLWTSFGNCDGLLRAALSKVEGLIQLRLLRGRLCKALGESLRMQNQYAEALTLLKESQTIFQETEFNREVAQCTQSMGDIHYMQDEYDRASDMLKEAFAIFREFGDSLGAAQCTRSLGDIFRMKSQHAEAAAHLKEAERSLKELGDFAGAAQCTRSLGNLLRSQAQYKEASALLEEARAAFIELGDPLRAARCTQSLGDILRIQNHWDDASTMIEEAQKVFNAIGNRFGQAQCSKSLGDICRVQNRFDEAYILLNTARSTYFAIGDRLEYARCMRSSGDVLYSRGRHEEAYATLKEAQKTFLEVQEPIGAADCLQMLGDFHRDRDEYEEASALLEEARKAFKAHKDFLGAAQCARSLGDILCLQDRYDRATLLLAEARRSFSELGDNLGEAQCQKSLGKVLLLKSQYKEASTLLCDAQRRFEELKWSYGVAQCAQLLGSLLSTEGQYEEASTLLREARAKFVDAGNLREAAQCTKTLGDILCMTGQYIEAIASLEQARNAFEDLRDSLGAAQCKQSFADVHYMLRRYDEAHSLSKVARETFHKIGSRRGIAQSAWTLSNTLRSQKRYGEASAALTEAKMIWEEIGDVEKTAQCIEASLALQDEQERQLEKGKAALTGHQSRRFKDTILNLLSGFAEKEEKS